MEKQINSRLQIILDNDVVIGHSHWTTDRHDRVYLTLKGYDRSFRGCQTTKVYWDNNRDELVVQDGRGTTPREFDASLEIIKSL